MECRVVRVIGNTAAKGVRYGPRALTLSEDGSRLAFIGPMEFTVTVLDAHTMEEVSLGGVGGEECFSDISINI